LRKLSALSVDAWTTRYARAANGTSISYQVAGSGPPDLVFVPGFVSNLEVFREEPAVARFYERLASFSRLILFDKRGTGLSDPLQGPQPLEERIEDVDAVMDAVGSTRAALVGLSEGAAMAIVFAATYPDRTSALVLCGAVLGGGLGDYPAGDRLAEAAYDLAARIRGAELVEFPGRDHVPWFGDTESYVAEIEEFLTGAREHGRVNRVLATVLLTDGAGEVLVSSTVKELVIGSGLEFEDHGTHSLKGVPGRWHLYSAS
jgi:pimeloyl-ACP methyl ester carboxylesterase